MIKLQVHTPREVVRLLADRIRSERLRLNWKQVTLAERAGVSLPTLRRYERTGVTSIENLLRLCHALGHLDEFADLLKPPSVSSLAELQARSETEHRKRGSR